MTSEVVDVTPFPLKGCVVLLTPNHVHYSQLYTMRYLTIITTITIAAKDYLEKRTKGRSEH